MFVDKKRRSTNLNKNTKQRQERQESNGTIETKSFFKQ